MSKNKIITILGLLLVCVIIAIFPLMTIKDSEFGGADAQAEQVITEVSPGYQPWASSPLEVPGGETESLLFCLQTAIGAIVIGYGFGYYVARKKFSKDSE